MAPRIISLVLGTLGFAGLTVAVACGGGGDGEEPTATATPPADSRGLQPSESASAAAGFSPAATSTPSGPLAPEGAVPRLTTRNRGGTELISGTTGSTDPDDISFVTPLDEWDDITGAFGVERGVGLFHGGIDFGLENHPNAPIYAACDGWVAGINESATHGKHLIVKCGETMWTTVYAHIGETLVKLNDDVVAGETIIAHSGGETPWGHEMLHFELRWDFVPVDPAMHIDFNVRPSFTIPSTPTPTPTSTPEDEPEDETATPTPPAPTRPAAGVPAPGEPTQAHTPTQAPTHTPTVTPTATQTPTPTLWYQPTPTPRPPAATATPVPTRTPTPTPTPRAPTPTPTPLPQTF